VNLALSVPDWQPAGRPVLLPPRPAELAGREAQLDALRGRLTEPDGPWPRIAVLHGLGGTGKTSLAAEYAHRHQASFGIVWHLAAEDRTGMETGFARLGALLGVAGRVLDSRPPVASVHTVLADSGLPWLLIFDNAPDPASVRNFLPRAGRGQILITSQHGLWPPGQGIEVGALDVAVAADFLASQTGDPDRAAARDLAAALGGLPLALAHAAAYTAAAIGSLAGYLELFRQRRAEALARREDDTSEHPAGVAVTLGLALSRLEVTAPEAVALLRLLAVLAAEPVPVRLLLAGKQPAQDLDPHTADALSPLLGDELARGNAIAALRRYSLVTPAGGGTLLVHRLVQAVTADQMTADVAGAWRQAAAGLVEAAIPADPDLPHTWPLCAALLPHARAVLPGGSSGMARIVNYIGASGSYATARDLQREIVSARQTSLGPEHPQTLGARGDLARWTAEAGDAASARDQFSRLLPACDRVLSPEHPRTLQHRGELGNWTGEAGDAASARDQFSGLQPVCERVLGPEHPQTLYVGGDLAWWTGEAGDAASARDQFAGLLPVCERALRHEHPATLAARLGLARWTGEAGDSASARDQYAGLLPACERVLGREHPRILQARGDLAYWTGQAGDPAAARDQYAALLPLREKVSGAEHPDTLTARASLASFTALAGDPAAARDQYRGLLPTCERVLGREHPRTLQARDDLAYWTGQAGDPAAARDQCAALLPLREKVSGAEHPDTLTARVNLARWTGQAGDPAAARDQFAGLLPVCERVLGPEHPQSLTARTGLARWTRQATAPGGPT
jgi:hypothetical protein